MLFFNSIFVGVLLGQFIYVPSYGEGNFLNYLHWLRNLHWSWMIAVIFLSNILLSGFVFLTLPGLIFFPLSAVILAVRGVLWGVMLNGPSIVPSMLVLPTFILEGEGYVLTSMMGIHLGLSWQKPEWLYGRARYGSGYSSGLKALQRALEEALHLLFLSSSFFLLGAVVETITVFMAR